MIRSLPAALAPAAVTATLLLGLFSGTALAGQDPPPTGPDTPECAELRSQLNELRGELADAVAADNEAGLPQDSQAVVTLKTQVQTASGLADEACALPEPSEDPEPPADETPEPTTEPPAGDEPFYATCIDAITAGVAPINSGNDEPGYRPELDPDGDGIACEAGEEDAGGGTPPSATPAPSTDNDTGSDIGDLDGLSSDDFDGPATTVPRGGVDTGWAE